MKQRILLVEDDPSVGPVILEILLASGYEAALANSYAAVKRLTHFDFSAVIADFQLLDGDACDVIQFLREKIPGLPSLVMSGYGRLIERDCMDRRLSAVVFLDKPFRPQQLREKLNALLPDRNRVPDTTRNGKRTHAQR